MDSICVLISTYNGEEYLQSQLDSIENQRGNFEVLYCIRDDGSQDNTVELIQRWGKSHKISFLKGQNIGVKESFLLLLQNAPEADYYALCDQDDLWADDKLPRALERLKVCGNLPALYYSAQEMIDQNGKSLGKVRAATDPRMTFENSFIYNYVPGCAQVFNKALLEKIRQYKIAECVMHDMVPLQIAGLFGKIIYDEKPTIYYRQHAANVTTAQGSIIKKFKLHWQVWVHANNCPLQVQAQEYLKKVDTDLPPEARAFLTKAACYKSNISAWYWLWSGHVQAYGGWKRNKSFRLRVFFRLA
jgi:glycosyltransferase involved in cell wall biosynthesis